MERRALSFHSILSLDWLGLNLNRRIKRRSSPLIPISSPRLSSRILVLIFLFVLSLCSYLRKIAFMIGIGIFVLIWILLLIIGSQLLWPVMSWEGNSSSSLPPCTCAFPLEKNPSSISQRLRKREPTIHNFE